MLNVQIEIVCTKRIRVYPVTANLYRCCNRINSFILLVEANHLKLVPLDIRIYVFYINLFVSLIIYSKEAGLAKGKKWNRL